MKKCNLLLFLLASVLIVFNSCSDDDGGDARVLVTLDLSNVDLSDGDATEGGVYWSGTYDVDKKYLDCQIFRFVHTAVSDGYWYGFTVSNSNENSKQTDWLANQFSCMEKGGANNESTPFIVAYVPGTIINPVGGQEFSKEGSMWVEIKDTDNRYNARGVYVCNNSWAYYSILDGGDFNRKFAQGDYFVLKAYGVGEDNIIKTTPVEFYLADYRSATESEWKLNDKWEWMDLSALGEVKHIIFSLVSTDTGEWGINTPTYFCLDQLTVEKIN